MALMDVFSRVVEGIGEAAIILRGQDGRKVTQAFGANPTIPAAKAQGNIPTLKMPTARGWSRGQAPKPAPGLKVNAFATDLKHPRWICVLPNGDVLAAEALLTPEPATSLFDYAMFSTLKRAAAMGESPNRITLMRDADHDGVAEVQNVFLEGLRQPFGMALLADTLYVGNTDGVVAYPYATGASRIAEPGRRLTTHNGGGHWTRSLLLSPDKTKLYIGVGSLTNIADKGMAVEQGRAAIHELDLARGKTVDDRVPQDAALVASAIQPDYALGGHTASLGLCWLPAGVLPGFPEGMVIGQHGSWNRSALSGYKVVFVPFSNGRPVGPSREILSGFLAPDERSSFGRPVGVALGPDGSLLVADDVGNAIWRVTGA